MKFVIDMEVSDQYWSMCHVEHTAYFGNFHCIDGIKLYYRGNIWAHYCQGCEDEDDSRNKRCADCIRAYKQRLYVLRMKTDTFYMIKCNDDIDKPHGDKTIWSHIDDVTEPNQFAIQNDTIFIPCRSENVIKQYTLSGETMDETIPIQLAATSTQMCATAGGQLIVCQTVPPLLTCIDPTIKQQLWSRRDLMCPQGITTDSYHLISHILVFSDNVANRKPFIDVRNSYTGKA